MARTKTPKRTPRQRKSAKRLRQAWLATLPTCTTCTRKVLEPGECIHCYMERLYGKASTITGAAATAAPAPRKDP